MLALKLLARRPRKLSYIAASATNPHLKLQNFAGPSAFICAECIDLCLDIIIEETADENEVVVRIHGPGEVSSELEFIFVNFIAQGLAFIKKDYRVGVRSVRTISKMV